MVPAIGKSGVGALPGAVYTLVRTSDTASNKTDYDQRKSPWDGNAVWQPLNLFKPTRNTQQEKENSSCRPRAKGKSELCAVFAGVSLRNC